MPHCPAIRLLRTWSTSPWQGCLSLTLWECREELADKFTVSTQCTFSLFHLAITESVPWALRCSGVREVLNILSYVSPLSWWGGRDTLGKESRAFSRLPESEKRGHCSPYIPVWPEEAYLWAKRHLCQEGGSRASGPWLTAGNWNQE